MCVDFLFVNRRSSKALSGNLMMLVLKYIIHLSLSVYFFFFFLGEPYSTSGTLTQILLLFVNVQPCLENITF